MKIFQNRNIFKKLIIVFLSVLLLGFCTPKTVKANAGNEEGLGGKLLEPIMSMFVGFSDGAISLLQKIVLRTDGSMIEVNTSVKGIGKILGIFVAAAVVIGGTVAVVASGGISLAIVGSVLTVLKAGAIAGVVTYFISSAIAGAVLPEDFVLPQISLSPYEIFANQIPLFDVDFFNPSDDVVVDNTKTIEIKGDDTTTSRDKYIEGRLKNEYGYDESKAKKEEFNGGNNIQGSPDKYTQYTWDYKGKTYAYSCGSQGEWFCTRYDTGTKGKNWEYLYFEDNKDNYGLKLSWKDNAANAVWDTEAGSADVVEKGETKTKTEGKKETISSTAKQLRQTISSWYIVLRDLSLVALLSVLVYVGIRIIISSTSKDKAKYKQMLMDWLVAICLLFVMHYIMAFSNMIVKKFINLIDATNIAENKEDLPENTASGTISDSGVAVSKGVQMFEITQDKQVKKAYEVLVENHTGSDSESEFTQNFEYDDSGKPIKLKWPANNFTEQARMMLQFVDEDDGTTNYAYAGIGYKLIYCVLVVYTIIFTFTYLKRTVYMAFLTLIAPLVAATYPIDKMNDGQAQAFNKWFKEYIFNLLIQPLHLILYMVLIGSAMDFAAQNIIYVVIALLFLTQGEKLLRMFFGFEKAHTPGFLAGPAGAAIMMNGFNKLLGRPPHKGGKPPKELGGETAEKADNKINMKENLDTNSMFSVDGQQKGNEIRENPVFGLNVSNDNSKVSDPNLGLGQENVKGNIGDNMKFDEGNKKIMLNQNISRNRPNISGRTINNKQNTSRAKRSAIRGIKNMGDRIRMKSPTTKDSLRALSGIAGAAVATGAAGIIGITSGDVGKAAQYMGVAAMGGYNFAKQIPNEVGKAKDNIVDYADAFKEGYYTDDEYKQMLQKRAVKEAAKNEELNRSIKDRLERANIEIDKDELKDIRKACVEHGLDNANDISTVYQEVNVNWVLLVSVITTF